MDGQKGIKTDQSNIKKKTQPARLLLQIGYKITDADADSEHQNRLSGGHFDPHGMVVIKVKPVVAEPSGTQKEDGVSHTFRIGSKFSNFFHGRTSAISIYLRLKMHRMMNISCLAIGSPKDHMTPDNER